MADLVCKAGTHKVAQQYGEKKPFTYTCEPDVVPAWTGTPSAPSSTSPSRLADNSDSCYILLARGWKNICKGK